MLFEIPSLSRPAVAILGLLPIIAPTAYLLALKAIVSNHISASTTNIHTPPPKKGLRKEKGKASAAAASEIQCPPPHSLPGDVLEQDSQYVVSCERVVSRPVPVSAITVAVAAATGGTEVTEAQRTSALLSAFLRGTMEAFSWTPQALAVRGLVSEPALRHTFDADYIRALDFAPGDLVNGVHRVTWRNGSSGSSADQDGKAAESAERVERAELMIEPLPGSPDIVVHIIIVSEVRRSAAEAVFVNEAWMWRRASGEKPTLLEGSVGRWLHALLAGWLVTKGIWAVTASKKDKAA